MSNTHRTNSTSTHLTTKKSTAWGRESPSDNNKDKKTSNRYNRNNDQHCPNSHRNDNKHDCNSDKITYMAAEA